jgi:hypothetical protein
MHTAKEARQSTPRSTLTWMFPSGWLRRWPPPQRDSEDALTIFLRWRAAAEFGHKTAAAAELMKLEKLVERPPTREISLTTENTEKYT